MLNREWLIGVLIINAFRLLGQDSTYGIYKSAEDYKNKNLSCEIEASSPGKIKLHHFFSGKYVDIIRGGEKYRFYKDSIFGYCNCKNEDFRFYKTYDEEYRILENKDIVIYLSYVIVSPYNAKHIQIAPAYFFSRTIDSKILPLTVLNLKKAYPENLKFHDMLDMEFGNEGINAEDTFKINQLLKQLK